MKSKEKSRIILIAILLLLLLVASSICTWALVTKKQFQNNLNISNWYSLEVETAEFSCAPSADSDAYMVIGKEVYDNYSTQRSGGKVNIMPDIIPQKYLVGYSTKTIDVVYNFSYWHHIYYEKYNLSVYDISNPIQALKEIDVLELLKQQYPGRSLSEGVGLDHANGIVTIYDNRPCVLLRVYDPAQDNRSKDEYSVEAPIQIMALDLEMEVLEDVDLETRAARWNESEKGDIYELLGVNADYRVENNIPFTGRQNAFIDGGIILQLQDTCLEGYDAPICDMFPTLLQEARGMNWGDRMEIFLYGDIPTEQLVELVTPR